MFHKEPSPVSREGRVGACYPNWAPLHAVVVALELGDLVAGPLGLGIERLEQPAADDLVSLIAGRRQPGRLHTPEYNFEPQQRFRPARPTGFGCALGCGVK
jgi:hypothetical protein